MNSEAVLLFVAYRSVSLCTYAFSLLGQSMYVRVELHQVHARGLSCFSKQLGEKVLRQVRSHTHLELPPLACVGRMAKQAR